MKIFIKKILEFFLLMVIIIYFTGCRRDKCAEIESDIRNSLIGTYNGAHIVYWPITDSLGQSIKDSNGFFPYDSSWNSFSVEIRKNCEKENIIEWNGSSCYFYQQDSTFKSDGEWYPYGYLWGKFLCRNGSTIDSLYAQLRNEVYYGRRQ